MRDSNIRRFGWGTWFWLGLFCLILPSWVAAVETETVLPVETTVKQATVFPSMARVERTGSVTFTGKGPVRLDLVGLSRHATQESFQFGGEGSARVRVLGSALERKFATEEIDEEIKLLTAQLENFQRKDQEFSDEISAVQSEKKFVESLVSTYAKDTSSNLALRKMNVNDWMKAGEFVSRKVSGLSAKIREFDKKRAELKKEMQNAQTQLNQLRSKRGRWTTVAHVDVEVLKPGRFALSATYLVPNARWSMVYDARIFPDKGDVEVGVYATVVQNTGTDWNDVELVLSTARPSISGTIPELYPRYVNIQSPQPVLGKSRKRLEETAPEAMEDESMLAGTGAMGALLTGNDARRRFEMAQATLDTVGMATFTAPTKSRIPSDNQVHKIFLLSKVWQAASHYEVAPEISPHAYLAAKTENRFDFPMLAGEMNLFMQDDYVGRASLQTTQAGEELTLPFGIDERVRVERRLLNRKRSESGVFEKSTEMQYRYSIKVSNTYSTKAVSVKLHERILCPRTRKSASNWVKRRQKVSKKIERNPVYSPGRWIFPKGKTAKSCWITKSSTPRTVRFTVRRNARSASAALAAQIRQGVCGQRSEAVFVEEIEFARLGVHFHEEVGIRVVAAGSHHPVGGTEIVA